MTMPEQVLSPEKQPAEKPFPWRCPNCRQLTVNRVTMPYHCQRKLGSRIVIVEVPNLTVPRCSNCGEIVFDYDADEQIREAFRTRFGCEENAMNEKHKLRLQRDGTLEDPGRPNARSGALSLNERFRELVDGLDNKCQALLSMVPVIAQNVSNDTPHGGVYLFSEGKNHLYAGRTKRKIAVRIKNHFSTASDCPFAWLLAREATNWPEGTRKTLLADSNFKAQYEQAKDRIRQMSVRYVHEPDPVRQALLEIYVAIATEAKHNDFETS